ncbi:MAG: outer membrane protein assembly factor BamD [Gammaproteobacteria bacterium]|nr:outer membrane protein assembly factor BamD [Gammaproteobacteria bacterium]
MKRLLFLGFAVLLMITACSNEDTDDLKPYRHMTSEQLFQKGEEYLAKGRYDQATKYFEALDAIYPFGPNSRQGELDVIYAYYANSDAPSAIAAADRFINLHPQDPDAAYALYMKGVILYNQGMTWLQRLAGSDPASRDLSNKKEAYLAFSELLKRYPHSRYTRDAAVRMLYIRNMIAKREIQIARFYIKRQAYVAAANRASIVVQHYNGTPAVIPALTILVESYRYLGLTQMANNTLKVFRISYPNAPQLKKLLNTA